MAFTSIVSSQAVTCEVVINGTQSIVNGGIANKTFIISGGIQNISSGGITNSSLITSNSQQNVYFNGVANSTIINSGGSQYVSSGGVANSTIINFDGMQEVDSGGVANSTTINGYAYQSINSGGVANSTIIIGQQYVSSDALANFTTIISGGMQHVGSGGVANSTAINYGYLTISSGGIANLTTINSDGSIELNSGGSANVINQQSGGGICANTSATITSGTNTRTDGHSAFSIVRGVASNFLLGKSFEDYRGGGCLYVSRGHSAIDTVIASNGFLWVHSGGVASNTIVNSGGSMYVSSGGIVSGALIITGGHVTMVDAASVNRLTTLSYVLTMVDNDTPSYETPTWAINDALLRFRDGTLGTGVTAYSLNLDNTATGTYILASGSDLTAMSNKTFSVTDDGQNVNVQVGSIYTFADGDNLSLNFIDAATDQLTATFTVGGPITLPQITIDATAYAWEPADNGTFRISRTGDTTSLLTVNFSTSGTATGGSDYTLKNGSTTLTSAVVIAAGQSYVDVTLGVIDDAVVENTETVILNLTADAAYTLGATTSGTINIADNDPDGNTLATAEVLAANNSVAEWFSFGDAADYFKLTMDNNGMLNLNLTSFEDTNLLLLDNKGKVLKSSAVKGAVDENITNATLLAGDYFVKVTPATTVNDYSDYKLINFVDYFPTDTVGNTFSAAALLAVNDTVADWVGFGDPADYYKLTLDTAGKLSLNLADLNGDANMTLYDAKGKSLKSSSLKGLADENITDLALLKGDYYVKVAPADGGKGIVNNTTYTLSNTVNYFPADTVGNTIATAGTLETNGSADEWVGFGDPADYYKLTLDTAGKLSLNLADLNGDANMTLYDAKGKSLKSSSLKGLADENITDLALLKGDYYVKVAPADGVFDASYKLSNVVDYFPADTVGNTLATSGVLETNGFADEWVGFGDTADYYKLTLDSAGKLSLNLADLTGDANMTLYDAKGKSLKSSSVKGLADENIANLSLAGGDYYVKVAPASGVTDAAYSLSNKVDYFPADTAGNAFATAWQVIESRPVNEWLGFGDKDDYYMFELQASTAVTLDLADMTSNVNMYLYDSKSRQLAASAKSGNTDESITKTLAAGKYYVKATLAGKENTDYSLNFGIDPSAFKTGSLQLSSAASPLTGSADASQTDPLKKNNGLLAS